MKEDMENAKRTRDEKPKGKQMFLQKYWHKGAFYQVHYYLSLFCLVGLMFAHAQSICRRRMS